MTYGEIAKKIIIDSGYPNKTVDLTITAKKIQKKLGIIEFVAAWNLMMTVINKYPWKKN